MRFFQVRLDDAEYEALAKKAEARGASLQAAGREAVLNWVADKPVSPFGQISKDEERLLRAMLRYSREAPSSDVFKQAIPGLIKFWGPK